MKIKGLIPRPIKKILRGSVTFARDQGQRAHYLLDCLKGNDLWIRPSVRRRSLRLGYGDGEWCFCPDALDSSSIVYSFGVGWNITFDLALIERFGLEVHAFDPTPISQEWLEGQPPRPIQFKFHALGLAGYDGTADFTLPASHGVSFTMKRVPPTSVTAHCDVRRLTTIFDMLGHDKVHLLKLDIEGAEYDVIADLAAAADRIDQILIEFHHRMFADSAGLEHTRRSINILNEAGYRLFHVSPRGLEYSFIRMPTKNGTGPILTR